MLVNNLKGLLMRVTAAAAVAMVAGCASTPLPPDLGCGVPGGLCAPAEPNTSAPRPPPPPEPTPAPRSETRTIPIELYPREGGGQAAVPGAQARVALLLPLQSNALAKAAEAVRAGFMAGHERDGAGIEVQVVASGDSTEDTLQAYARAAEQNDIVVGPLARSAVAAVASSNVVTKPTVALNHPQIDRPLPAQMLVIGLSLEEEARQVAEWAAQEQASGRALVLGGSTAWQQRIVGAFTAQWARLGRNNATVELPVLDGYVDANALAELRKRLEIDRPDLVFAALDANQLRQVRSAIGTSLPTYGVSAANPGRTASSAGGWPELDGVRMLDLPWTIQPEHPQVMVYPRPVDADTLDMQRLYALGIDAFRVAREVAQHPGSGFELDGVTGRLSVRMNNGAYAVKRQEAAAVYRDGLGFEAVATRP